MLRTHRIVHAEDTGIDLVTIPNVELLEVGMDWRTSTGVFTFTEDDLVSAIDSQNDPSIRTPVLKFGHTDPRFDGQFSIGRVENFHLTNNNQTLCGDYVGVPRWLAEIIPAAYPRRSIEGAWDVDTYTGNRWPFQLTAIALLGDRYPAIATIEDIKLFWQGEPDVIENMMVVAESDDVGVRHTAHGIVFRAQPVEASVPLFKKAAKVEASVETDDVRRQFYDSLELAQSWWWIRAIQIDPAQLIVDDDDGGLYRVAYHIKGDVVTFDDPIKVKVEYQDVAARVSATFEAAVADPQSAVYPTRDASRGGIVQPRATSSTPPEDTMNEAQKALIGLKADATDEQVTARLTELAASSAAGGDGEGETEGGPTTPANPGGPNPAGPPGDPTAPAPPPPTNPTPPKAEVPDGMVLVDAATLEELRTGLTEVRATSAEAEKARRTEVVNAALKEGKIPRSRRDHYDKLMASKDADTVKATEELLAAMPSGLIPVDAEAGMGEFDAANGEAIEAYPPGWLPEVQARAAAGGERPVIVTEA